MNPRWSGSRPAVLLCCLLLLGGCAVAVGAGATAGVAALEDRDLKTAARDLSIEKQIQARIFDFDHVVSSNIGVEVYEGRVLLTGTMPNAKIRATVVQFAWQIDGVKQVLNEIQPVAPDKMAVVHDTAITSSLKNKITWDRSIYAINYFVETVNGTVYLLGVARSETELERVKAHARGVDYVRKIVSHVRIKPPAPKAAPQPAPQPAGGGRP